MFRSSTSQFSQFVRSFVQSSTRSNSTFVGTRPSPLRRLWNWTIQERPHWKDSPVEAAVLFCVFGITGSSSVALVRPALKNTLGIEGNMRDGPWSYRIASVVLVSPIYAMVLLCVGTAAGRHRYFATMSRNIFARFLPASMRQKLVCSQARSKIVEKTVEK
eukprot:c8050_g1_i1.p1 GENE.c8050_g1_i1~~c8050_g1_i1.p1  ORF type:complete len:173 (+),score=69.57 c8050_g1_i1:37-519(+)